MQKSKFFFLHGFYKETFYDSKGIIFNYTWVLTGFTYFFLQLLRWYDFCCSFLVFWCWNTYILRINSIGYDVLFSLSSIVIIYLRILCKCISKIKWACTLHFLLFLSGLGIKIIFASWNELLSCHSFPILLKLFWI